MKVSQVAIQSGDVELAGTLTVPRDAKALVVFIHGSGPLDRDQNSAGAKLNTFRDLAQDFGEAGYASLRWDKRGCGVSQGHYATLRQADLIADIGAMIDFAVSQNLGPVYLCGHSEGTALAPAASNGRRDVAGLVLLCPYVTSGAEILLQQAARHDAMVAQAKGWQGRIARLIARIIGKPTQVQARMIKRLKRTTGDTIRVGRRKIPATWLRDFVTADVVAIHQANTKPTLIVVAQRDAQCPPEDGSKIAALCPQADLVEMADLSHLLRHTQTNGLEDYGRQLGEGTDARVSAAVLDWLNGQNR